ncbi:MAG: DNA repair protein RecO [Alphaproteobacteria bacterium]|nr:DNA repair protein RecO [Alphaproteobacteria bacterium]
MKFTDEGYIINLCKHGERSLILTVLTQNHGKIVGYVKNCLSKKNLSTYQLGNHIKIDAYSRLDENMPTFRVELITPSAVFFMQQESKLHALSSFCALSNICMPEFQDIENFYIIVADFFNGINTENWLKYYVFFEFHLLEFLGIGLDLSECSATGTTQNLAYVSPKTGKAVCQEAGEPYKNRLYLYPKFILDKSIIPDSLSLIDALKMTSFFLNKNFFAVHGLKFPKCRDNLATNIYK